MIGNPFHTLKSFHNLTGKSHVVSLVCRLLPSCFHFAALQIHFVT